MTDLEQWQEIVPPLPEAEAVERYLTWKKLQEGQGRKIQPEQVRRDLVHDGPGQGCVVRFLFKK